MIISSYTLECMRGAQWVRQERTTFGKDRREQLSERKDGDFCLVSHTLPRLRGFNNAVGRLKCVYCDVPRRYCFDAKTIIGTASSYVSQEPPGTHFE